ncbi:MAG: ribosome-associated translation inhibitor RaiA [Alphaproteobacteria bacterium]|nr:ribosome-associated translation inhibitor RaiA [Alphaproteobacteria bacterium]
MQLSVHGKQIDVGDALRSHIEESLPTIVTKYFDNPTDAHVTLTREGKGFKADISVHVGKGIIVQSHAASEDAYAAFDTATVHIAKRLRRYKRRLRDHHRGRDEGSKSIEAQQYVLEPSLETHEEPSADDQPLIVAEMSTNIERLTVSEAVMRMDLSGQPALLFHNSANGAINLVYLRSDGNIGWIDTNADGAVS